MKVFTHRFGKGEKGNALLIDPSVLACLPIAACLPGCLPIEGKIPNRAHAKFAQAKYTTQGVVT